MSLGLKAAGLVKEYPGRAVVGPLTFEAATATITAVIGPNGCGKSTLIGMLAGLLRPDSGTVEYRDGSLTVPPGIGLMRRITCVRQDPVLFSMTVRENIAYGLKLRGLPKPEIESRVDEALDAAGLTGLAGADARELSGGQAKRAAIARAYALRPDAVFLDEPGANLDPDGVVLLEGLIRRMRERFGTTVVLVTHNLFEARRLPDRVLFLYGGRLVEQGTPDMIFGSPNDPLTRGFISGEAVY